MTPDRHTLATALMTGQTVRLWSACHNAHVTGVVTGVRLESGARRGGPEDFLVDVLQDIGESVTVYVRLPTKTRNAG